MDPASIVGLVEFGLSCASAISNVISDIHGGAEDVRKLITQIEATVFVVRELDRVIDDNKRTKAFHEHGLLLVRSSREDCEQILVRLKTLLVRAGATVKPEIPPGEFYKIRATDIDRSIFHTADWARHKKKFDEVTKELEGVKISVLVALQVYRTSVAHLAEQNNKQQELVELFQYLKDSGKKPEDIIPQSPEATPPSTPSEARSTTSLDGLGPEPQETGTGGNPDMVNQESVGNKATGNDSSKSESSGSDSSGSESSGSDSSGSDSSGSDNSRSQNSMSSSYASYIEETERLPRMFAELENDPIWYRLLRNTLQQDSHRLRDESSSKRRNKDGIPHILQDKDRPDGIALTRSFLLSRTESGLWTSREWEYPFGELLKRLSRKGVAHNALHTFGILPQPCKDLINQISKDNNESVYWTTLLIDPIPCGKKFWLTRLLNKGEKRADSISSVFAVLKRCRQAGDFDRELKTAIQEIGAFIFSGIRMETEKQQLEHRLLSKEAEEGKLRAVLKNRRREVQRINMELDSAKAEAEAKAEVEAKDVRDRALAREAHEKTLAEEKAAKEKALLDAKTATEALRRRMEDEAQKIEQEEEEVLIRRRIELQVLKDKDKREEEKHKRAEHECELRRTQENKAKETENDAVKKERRIEKEAEQAKEAADEEKRRSDDERLRRLEETITVFQDKQKEFDERTRQKEIEETERKAQEAIRAKDEIEKKSAVTPALTGGEEKAPIKFKDAIGRKFSFPWRLCKDWKGVVELIKQAFAPTDGLGQRVHDGHWYLVGPDGEVILPTVWENVIQPGWAITMHMWPPQEAAPPSLEPRSPMAGNSLENHHSPINLGDHQQQIHHPGVPTYVKVHKDHIEVTTLTYFGLPWEYDRADNNYIIILKEMSNDETNMLFEHTKALRQRMTLRIEERPTDLRKPDFVWARRKSKKSKAPMPAEDLARMAMKAYTGLEYSVPSGTEEQTRKDTWF